MQEANNKVEEVEEKMRNLKEELEMIRYKKQCVLLRLVLSAYAYHHM
jgi:hypothetical protein